MNIIHALGVCLIPYHPALSVTNHARHHSGEAHLFGRVVTLGHTQVVLLHTLMRHQGYYVNRGVLLDCLSDTYCFDRSVDSAVRRLRQKLFPGNRAAQRLFIETQYGRGYRIPARSHQAKEPGT